MSQTWDTPDWQRSPLVPFINLDLARVNVGPNPPPVVQLVNVPGGLGGLVVLAFASGSGSAKVVSLPSNTTLYTVPVDATTHFKFLRLTDFVPGDTQLQFTGQVVGFPGHSQLRAYAVIDTALVFTDSNFPLAVSPVLASAPVLSVAVDATFAANAYATVVAGVAGQTIRVLSISGSADTATGGSLGWYDGRTGSPPRIASSPFQAVGALSLIDLGAAYGGRALTAGNGLFANPLASGPINWRGTVTYTQT